mmetsp:Transcript_51578/g.107249  ORF Transcript_51578/g.107249 Transcript_51578/m.107249 type:complete len:208 (-) Transcript_51578:72-695(-)
MLNECKCYRGIKSLQPVQLVAGPSQAQSSLRFSGPIHQVQAQAVLRLLVVLQVHADAQEVGGAGRLAALATHAVLHSRGRSHLLGCVDSGRDHLQHICGARTDAQSAANAGVVDLHSMGTPSQQAGTLLASAGSSCGCTNGHASSGHASQRAEGPRGISAGAQPCTMRRLLQPRLHLEACWSKGCRAETSQERDGSGCEAKGNLRHG